MTRRTILKGPFVMGQDINKSGTTVEWTPTGGVGETFPASGADSPWLLQGYEAYEDGFPSAEYQERDGRTVVRSLGVFQAWLWKGGNGFPQSPVMDPAIGFECKLHLYIDHATVDLRTYIYDYGVGLQVSGAYSDHPRVYAEFWDADTEAGLRGYDDVGGRVDDNTWSNQDWYVFGFRVTQGGTIQYQTRRDTDPDVWLTSDRPHRPNMQRQPFPFLYAYHRPDSPGIIDLWKFEWSWL